MPHDPYQALYLHIPFCKQRCGYCDFHTRAIDPDDASIDDYIDELCLEIRRWAKRGELAEIKTVYIGGGTPSCIGMRRLSELLYMLGVSMHLTPDVECSMEANPESLTLNMVRDLYGLGVNRLSMGVQSFDDSVLTTLGRIHNADRAREAIECAKTRFDNVSIDLMCGIPGQTQESFEHDVREAIAREVSHVSIYPLTIEPHTPFDHLVMAGKMSDVDEDVQAEMMTSAARILEAAGYHRYEVASYAKPGYECKHNQAYWTGVPYLGFGASAATMTQDATRRTRMQDGHVTDELNRVQMYAEDLMLGMRMSQGVSDELVDAARTELGSLDATLDKLAQEGLVEHIQGRWCPTERGWLMGNEIYEAMYELA